MLTGGAAYNDLETWREYCDQLGEHPFPRTIFDPLQIKASIKNEWMQGFWERAGECSTMPFDGDRYAEVRAPIARAIAAIRMAARAKRDFTRRSHLATAIKWLECPHPWQGEATKLEIAAMIAAIEKAIAEPSMSLEHLLDNSLHFKAQASGPVERPARPSLFARLSRKREL